VSRDGVRVDRVSLAVRDLAAARRFFEAHFGAAFGAVEDVAVDGYRYAPFTIGGFTLELLSPYRPDTPIGRFLDRRGEGLYQLSFMVDDLDAAVARLQAAGLQVLGPRSYPDDVVLEGCRWREAFVHPRDAFGVMLFLGERTPVATASPARRPPPAGARPRARTIRRRARPAVRATAKPPRGR
jgi:methylmalonyl-CoA/ethylmalonyl-CoA epimerase